MSKLYALKCGTTLLANSYDAFAGRATPAGTNRLGQWCASDGCKQPWTCRKLDTAKRKADELNNTRQHRLDRAFYDVIELGLTDAQLDECCRAASADLLQALKDCVRWFAYVQGNFTDADNPMQAKDKALAAIAKAEGRDAQ